MILTPEDYQRYTRQVLLPGFGMQAQQRLKAARVLVIGAGGLGCPALQYLASAGVGTIGIADDDTVELSNLQRQPLYSTAAIGKPKATEAANVLRALNPLIQINAYGEKLTAENAGVLSDSYDVLLDATDNIETRYLLDKWCRQLNKPWISGSVYRYEGQVAVWNCNGGPSYSDCYPEATFSGSIPDCETAGVLGVVPGIIGTLQAAECIKLLTGIGEPLSGRVLHINLLTMTTTTFSLPTSAKS